MTKARPGRPRILCYDQRYFCRMTLWLELMVGIIMTILGLFILLLSIESLKAGDYSAVYFCSSFILLGVVLLLVYYIHYYALKLSVKRQVQKLDASIKSDQDALAALARRGLQFSKFAAVRQGQPQAQQPNTESVEVIAENIATANEEEAGTATVAATAAVNDVDDIVEQPVDTSARRWSRQQSGLSFPRTSSQPLEDDDGMQNVSLDDLDSIWETRQTTV